MSGTPATSGHPERTDFIRYPTNRVVGTIADDTNARQAIEALLRTGFSREDIDILHGDEALHRLDLTGAEHGFLAQFQRTMIRSFDLEQHKHLAHHVEDVRAGRYVIMVLTKRREQRIVAGDILHQHGAEFVGFYGRWAWADLPPTIRMTPADVAATYARAWNTRDSNLLASLFDGDGDFVNTAGLRWHGRESIRHGHAAWLQGADSSKLAIGETNVKLLLPEVAVVEARMTRETDTPPAGTSAAAGEAIVTFVAHRVGERWLCAFAHHTDVIPVSSGAGPGPGAGAGRPVEADAS